MPYPPLFCRLISPNMATTVFVSGATGFIAQHTIVNLLNRGYSVVGLVRSEAKGEALKTNFASENFTYEVVEDLETVGAFDKALQKHPEVTVFLHTASPVAWAADDFEKDIILPAINGTKNVLKAIKATSPQIKKVVLTSSVVAQFQGTNQLARINEDSWNPITYEEAKQSGAGAYFGSKTFGERTAWDFVAQEKPNFSFCTINPVYVFGPQAFDADAHGGVNFSNSFLTSLLDLKAGQEAPETQGDLVDVRDVAEAHVRAFERPAAAGQRLNASAHPFTGQLLLDQINELFPQLKLPQGTPQTTPPELVLDDSRSRKILGIDYRPLRDTIADTIGQYLEQNK